MITYYTSEEYCSEEITSLLKDNGYIGSTKTYLDINFGFTVEEITLQSAMKWLREVHNIHINLDVGWLYFANALGWMYTITKILENGVDYVCSKGNENDKTFYSSYEQACEAAIKYCLENLI